MGVEVFRSASMLEAQMIVDLLWREGIEAQIVGGELPGAVGELPSDGPVSVRVEPVDQQRAESCLAAWEAEQPEPTTEHPQQTKPQSMASGGLKNRAGVWFAAAGLFLGGVMVGAAVIANYYRSPIGREGIDHNRDGILDEQFVYRGERLTQRLQDRNFDGQPDLLEFYDQGGLLLTRQWDDDFDGYFERQQRFQDNVPALELIDSDNDGFTDRRFQFRHGVRQK
ncbi:MAG: DUF2007 domain-containing protein [Gammaproteobacteria bacterium]